VNTILGVGVIVTPNQFTAWSIFPFTVIVSSPGGNGIIGLGHSATVFPAGKSQLVESPLSAVIHNTPDEYAIYADGTNGIFVIFVPAGFQESDVPLTLTVVAASIIAFNAPDTIKHPQLDTGASQQLQLTFPSFNITFPSCSAILAI